MTMIENFRWGEIVSIPQTLSLFSYSGNVTD